MTKAQEDEAAVDRVLQGDTAAYEEIVRRWQNPLINLAYRFFGERGRAEDLAQEAFLRAFRSLGQWRRDAAFSTWLFALATNLYRSEFRRIPPRTISIDEIMIPGALFDAVTKIHEADRGRAVRKAVQSLPPKYRDALLLFYFHEQDVATTAGTLRLSEGTVKARLARGRELLKQKLKGLL